MANDNTSPIGTPTEASATRGIYLPCPKCGEAECNITLDLSDLSTCHCPECSADFDLNDVRELIAKWSKVIRWVETFPAE